MPFLLFYALLQHTAQNSSEQLRTAQNKLNYFNTPEAQAIYLATVSLAGICQFGPIDTSIALAKGALAGLVGKTVERAANIVSDNQPIQKSLGFLAAIATGYSIRDHEKIGHIALESLAAFGAHKVIEKQFTSQWKKEIDGGLKLTL